MKQPIPFAPQASISLSRRRLMRGLAAMAAAAPFGAELWVASAAPRVPPAFEQVSAAASGISWVHTAGKTEHKYLPETSGAGCAFLDYDNDGWMDIYLVNSGKSALYAPPSPLQNALYRNNRDGTFTDVTAHAGVAGGGYGMGVAVGDYNGDGFADLYVTQYGRNILYRNNGDGTFTDVTEKSGVAAPGWSSSAVWFDYDNDGRLDLFVCQFAAFDPDLVCGIDGKGVRHYCNPRVYKAAPSLLFHNNGDGTFTDVSQAMGIAGHLGKAWGVVAADLDRDGRMDLFVANDTVSNFLYMNRGSHFEETGLVAEVAYSDDGHARSGMGVDAADFDQDGKLDLFVANIDQEIFSLYRNSGDGTFDDVSIPLGIGMATKWMSGWGLKFFDCDNDGNLDLILANGFPDDLIDRTSSTVTWKEPLLLFHNEGKAFRNVSAESGPVFAQTFAARGLALGDYNNDGAVDVLVSVNDGPPVLLRNHAAAGNHWLGLRLVGRKCNIDAVGATIVYQAGDLKRSRTKVGGGSFLSAHDPRVVLGIGPRTRFDWIEIQWPQPSGAVERFTQLPLDRYITIVEGTGKWV
jgi:hypothetical protein